MRGEEKVKLSSKLFPTRKFEGETTKSRDFRSYANVEKTTSWKP